MPYGPHPRVSCYHISPVEIGNLYDWGSLLEHHCCTITLDHVSARMTCEAQQWPHITIVQQQPM
jgi:hypothetical protein